jgi:catechol-2,3-dioxygenase
MRVSGLLNCGLQIPSLEAGRSFYTDFGLEVSEQGNALAVRCTGRDQDQVILTEGPRKRLDHVAFAVEPGSLPDWQRHLEGLGVRLLYIGDGLWFEDEEGNLVRLRDTGLAPWRPFPPEAFNVGDSVARTDAARWLVAAESPRPRRLGHMLIFVADIVAAETFYTRALGLRLSDRVPGKATFLNSGPGDHHVFGFVQSTHPGLHHTSFEVANIDQLGMGAQLMAANGHREGWGLGRHSLGSNLFHYIRDPWGSWIEYFTDIDHITEDWTPREWQTPPAVWCPLMPEQFLINLEDRP